MVEINEPNKVPVWVDTHCHLDAPEFDSDRDAVAAAARAAGVLTIVAPAITASTFAATLALRERYGCAVALGLHPVYINQHRDADLIQLRDMATRHRPVAIGEIGLDFFVNGLDAARQTEIFAAQLRLARDLDLPVLLHIRKSQDQVLKQLRRFGVCRGIAHAFNGSPQQADAFIEQGFKLGFGGVATFERARNIRRLAARLPLEAIVLETDAPDLPPAWSSPGRNEPAFLPRIGAEIAALRGLSPQALAEATARNAEAALGVPLRA
jgi:TatD DNase family protein